MRVRAYPLENTFSIVFIWVNTQKTAVLMALSMELSKPVLRLLLTLYLNGRMEENRALRLSGIRSRGLIDRLVASGLLTVEYHNGVRKLRLNDSLFRRMSGALKVILAKSDRTLITRRSEVIVPTDDLVHTIYLGLVASRTMRTAHSS